MAVRAATRSPSRRSPHTDEALARALDEALGRISDLAGALWAVRDVHAPAPSRGWLDGWLRPRRTVCRGCGAEYPCPTVRAVA